MSVKSIVSGAMKPPERKLFVAGCTAMSLIAGFVVVAFKPTALEAYKVMAEWLVYLFAAFGGSNALTWWSQRGQNGQSNAQVKAGGGTEQQPVPKP